MDSGAQQPQRNFILNIILSPDEPRLRAGWRLLLHTLLLGLISSVFLFAYLLLPDMTAGISADISLATLLAELASILFATFLARRFLDRRSLKSLGFNMGDRTWSDLVIGFVIPGLLMSLVFALELLFGWTTFQGWAWQGAQLEDVLLGLFSGLVAFTLVGFSEELLSRGYHLQNIKDGLNLGWALLLSSGIFALLHTANPNSTWISTLGILLAGYFLAYGWIRTGQLWLSIGLHIGWNFFEGNIFGFPVSGMYTFRLIKHNTTGPVLFTGGDFGPEAGLIILPVLMLGILLIRLYTQKRFTTPQETP
jgi:membrane protease YdiL (CAAX protease family)